MAEIGKDILQAKKLLEEGKLVAIPTETVYGLAANAINTHAVSKIFIAKNRPSFDPLILHVTSIDHAEKYTSEFPEPARRLAQQFWPGPLTLVLPKNIIVPDIVTSGLDTVAIRCPDHPLTQQLLAALDFPLAAPSANPFGYVSPTTPTHVNDQLGDKIPYILDGGPCSVGLESTIVGFENNTPVIYRRGKIAEEEMERFVGKVSSKLHSSSNPLAPGQLENHYSPSKKFFLGDIESLTKRFHQEKVGLLRFTRTNHNPIDNEIILSDHGDIDEAARNLFSALRQLDQMDVDVILAERAPDTGIGRAINDRLQRAAAK